MKQLSGIDASFLHMETPSVFGHVSSLNIYDPAGAPGGGGLEATKQILLERMDQLAPFRRRLVEVPLGLDLPYWIEDPDFDLDFHVRHHAVPPPGTPEQLSEIVSRIHARPLDRAKPLWELYVIEGYDEGRLVAQLTKVHHATIDGASGALMLAVILDTDPEWRPVGATAEWQPDEVPTDQQLLQRTLLEYLRRPEKVIRLSVHALRELAASTSNGGARVLADVIAQPMPGPLGSFLRDRLRQQSGNEVDRPPALPTTAAPRTPWNASIGPHRRFAFTTVPLEDAREIRRAVGCTFNDVVMALCSGTLRRYLLEHDALPDEPLIAMVPVSVRSGSETDAYENRVSALLADLATNVADPLARLQRVSASMSRAKEDFKAIPAEALQDFTRFAPPAIAARAMRMYSRLKIADRAAPPFNLIISNVPGPNYPLYSAGAELKHFYPVSAIADGQGLNMTVQSYNGNLDFGFIADRELIPDLWRMTELLQDSMKELMAATAPAPAPAKKPRRKRTA
jgi:WS/DGAT/MGAT family acyltransferase